MIMANLCVVTLLVSYLCVLIHGSPSDSQPVDWDDEDDEDPGEFVIYFLLKTGYLHLIDPMFSRQYPPNSRDVSFFTILHDFLYFSAVET